MLRKTITAGAVIAATLASGLLIPPAAQAATVPDAPDVVMTTGTTPSSIDIMWTDPLNDGGSPLTGYNVTWPGHMLSLPPTTHNLLVDNLTPGTNYTIQIAATNANGVGTPGSISAQTDLLSPSTPQLIAGNPRAGKSLLIGLNGYLGPSETVNYTGPTSGSFNVNIGANYSGSGVWSPAVAGNYTLSAPGGNLPITILPSLTPTITVTDGTVNTSSTLAIQGDEPNQIDPIRILRPDGTTFISDGVQLDSNGNGSFDFAPDVEGQWSAELNYGQASTIFTVAPIPAPSPAPSPTPVPVEPTGGATAGKISTDTSSVTTPDFLTDDVDARSVILPDMRTAKAVFVQRGNRFVLAPRYIATGSHIPEGALFTVVTNGKQNARGLAKGVALANSQSLDKNGSVSGFIAPVKVKGSPVRVIVNW